MVVINYTIMKVTPVLKTLIIIKTLSFEAMRVHHKLIKVFFDFR